jgi:hypothetical protein
MFIPKNAKKNGYDGQFLPASIYLSIWLKVNKSPNLQAVNLVNHEGFDPTMDYFKPFKFAHNHNFQNPTDVRW